MIGTWVACLQQTVLHNLIESDNAVDEPRVWVERMRPHGKDHAFLRVLIAKDTLHGRERGMLAIVLAPAEEGRIRFPILAGARANAIVRLVLVFESIGARLIRNDGGCGVEEVGLGRKGLVSGAFVVDFSRIFALDAKNRVAGTQQREALPFAFHGRERRDFKAGEEALAFGLFELADDLDRLVIDAAAFHATIVLRLAALEPNAVPAAKLARLIEGSEGNGVKPQPFAL